MHISYERIKELLHQKGYPFYTDPYKCNMIGIRSASREANHWDDKFLMIYHDDEGEPVVLRNDLFTTDPGIYYLKKKLLNPKGCFILKEGFYKDMWTIGNHKGYKAFVQVGKCTGYRDRNMDNVLDFEPSTEETGLFGINLHHGYDSKDVGPNSAGCQVFQYKEDLNTVLGLAAEHHKRYGKFSYALINDKDF